MLNSKKISSGISGRIFMVYTLAIFLSLFFLLPGCATKITGVRQDKSFTYDKIIQGKMGIGGVFSNFEDLSDKAKSKHASNLQYALQEERENYPIVPMPEVRDNIGKDRFYEIMDKYKVDGMLGKQDLQEIGSKAKVRYLVLIRIEEDVHSGPEWNDQMERRNRKGRITQKKGINVSRGRSVKVSGNVYDLEMAKVVWSGQVTTFDRNRVFYKYKKKSQLEGLADVVRAVKGDAAKEEKPMEKLYPAPPPPSLFKMFGNVFEGFADSMPED